MSFRQKLIGFLARIYFSLSGSPLRQSENLAPEGEQAATPERPPLLRRAAAEGCVLLKNEGVLPVKEKIALFGRVQRDTFYVGYGSGGDVIKPYRVSIYDGLERAGVPMVNSLAETYRLFSEKNPVRHGSWGDWPRFYPEYPLTEEDVASARKETETAVVVLGRAAGEDRDNVLEEGSYFLTAEEKRMLSLVSEAFPKTAVVLNIGAPIDLSFVNEYNIGALLLIWQGGMETGNACADLLTGKQNPCGKLADTFASSYSDYPTAGNFGNAKRTEYAEDVFVGYRHFETKAKDSVLYPFGFGLSYTTFSLQAKEQNGVSYRITNTGTCAGREVVQVYVQKPEGPARELAAFRKTKLLAPNESEEGRFVLDDRAFSVFVPGRGFVRLRGEYKIYCGTDVRSAALISRLNLEEKVVLETKNLSYDVPSPKEITSTNNNTFEDVVKGTCSAEDFAAQLSDKDLEALAFGAGKMDSRLGAAGNAGVLGGVTKSLRARGIPPFTMTDGPSGIRLKTTSSLLPIGTLLACTFDPDLIEEVYRGVGGEMKERGSDVLLAPAMNLHRDPLCGRNFEYYSEDPYLTGKIAAAAVRGVQSMGVSACPKHFCCNNQEFNRNRNDSVVSEKALRELYLRGFEICVKEGRPRFLMTSYNKINGVYAHYNAALVQNVLRGEWKFDGCVVTDWWMRKGSCPKAEKRKNNEARVYAGVNVLMPGGGYVLKGFQHGGLRKKLKRHGHITRAELVRNAGEVLSALAAAQRAKEEQHVVR